MEKFTVIRIAVLGLIFILLSGCQADNQVSPVELSRKAESAARSGDLIKAEKLYRSAIEIAGQEQQQLLPSILCDLGQVLADRGELEQSAIAYEKAYQIYSDNPCENPLDLHTCKENLARIYEKTGNYENEEKLNDRYMALLEKTIKSDPEKFLIRLVYGYALVDETRYGEAIEVFGKLLDQEIPPELEVEVLINMAQAKRILNKFNLGVVGVDKFASGSGLDELARAERRLESIPARRKKSYLQMLLGEEYYERIDPDPEEKRIEEGIETSRSSEYKAFRQNMLRKAKKYLGMALTSSAVEKEEIMDQLRTRLHLARVLLLAGDRRTAGDEMAKAYNMIESVPSLSDRVSLYFIAAEGYLLLAETTGKKEDRERAVPPLKKVISLDPTGKDALQAQTCFARLYMVDGKLHDAIKALGNANRILKNRANFNKNGNISDEWVFGMIILT
ncbi:MAG: tetratricopeptide repeat protein, partial [Candidatus Eremiobacteraeota bacterium]|nr:tetratricopeptide repeat protein [Candidatus Eremiobacteraeota bacterium]